MSGQSSHLTHPKYRADIDGLRAVAVLAVLGFHAFPHSLGSGFIGVDIFFVISGFLISSIIFSNLEHDSFSIVEFYNRRIRRIYPALVVVMLCTFLFGWFVLLADEYAQLGKHLAGGAAFISNFVLLAESGYFDASALTKPMLHLWSLAIEEQFYIFWPLLLAFVWKRQWSFLKITAAIALLSFCVNLYLLERNPSAAFYSPLSRFWELMIGGVLAYINLHRPQFNRWHKDGQSWLGLALLAVGFLLIREGKGFPGWWALLPTLGAALLISAGPGAWVNRRLLANPLLVWFGLISYPLYLWHWPLFSFAKIIELHPSRELRLVLLLASVALAWLTYRFVEKPLRFNRHGVVVWLLFAAMLALGAIGLLTWLNKGFEDTSIRSAEKTAFVNFFQNENERKELAKMFRNQCDFYDMERYRQGLATAVPRPAISPECYTRDPAASQVALIWGDSHAMHLHYGLRASLPPQWQVLQVTSSGCDPRVSQTTDSELDYCQRSNWFAMQTVAKVKPDVVVLAFNEGHQPERLEAMAAALLATGAGHVLLVGPTPHWQAHLPKIIVRKLWDEIPRYSAEGLDRKFLALDSNLKAEVRQSERVRYLSLIDHLCNEQGCLTHVGDDPLRGIATWDYGHFSRPTSALVGRELLAPAVMALATEGAAP